MPAGKTCFNIEWLSIKDKQGYLIKTWCKQREDKYSIQCFLCNKVPQLLQHSEGENHKKLAQGVCGGSQLTLVSAQLKNTKTGSGEDVLKAVSCISSKEQATKAELIWAMKVVSSHYSYRSCDGIKDIFTAMFPNCLPNGFSIGSSKVSYLVSEAVGPFFHQLLLKDVQNSRYSLLYDETTNEQGKKQLDIMIRFWSTNLNEVRVHHLRTYLLSKANAQKVANKLLDSISESKLPLKNLLMLGSDGPNVNKAVWTLMNSALFELIDRKSGLLDVGSCNIHVVFNTFRKGLDAYGKSISEFVIDLYQWFKLSPSRKEDYGNVQQSKGLKRRGFLKHVDCKWLTFLPAIERILEDKSVLMYYFLNHLPKEQSLLISNNPRYIRIKNHLQKKETMVQMHFPKSTFILFERFLRFFQREEPLVHLLYDEMLSLLEKLMLRFLKKELVTEQSVSLIDIDVQLLDRQLSNDDLEIGEITKKYLEKMPVGEQKLCYLRMKKFYEVASKYLQTKIPKQNSIIHHLRCLTQKKRTKSWTLHSIKAIGQLMPLQLNIDSLSDEWRAYQLEHIPESLYLAEESTPLKPVYRRIDHYWRDVCSKRLPTGESKYPILTCLIQSCLLISHGNSDVERGFSESQHNVTSDRCRLTEESVNAIPSTTDGLKFFDNQACKVPIIKEFLSLGRLAHCNYVRRLEENKLLERKKQMKKKNVLLKKRGCKLFKKI